MSTFQNKKNASEVHRIEMLRLATETLKGLPSNVTLDCWTSSLVVVKVNNFPIFRLLIDHKIGKSPVVTIRKDVQFLTEEDESVKKILVKQKKLYSETVIPEYLRMSEEIENIK
jgi:hypothetical protein